MLLVSDGEDNWFTVNYVSFSTGTVPNSTHQLNVNGGYTVVATANCTVQIVAAYRDSSNPWYIGLTDTLYTFDITSGIPQKVETLTQFSSASSNNWNGAAILVRNVTSGANVSFINGSLQVTKSTIPY